MTDFELKLSKMDKQVNKVYQFLEILEDYGHEYPDKIFFWKLKTFPQEIRLAAIEGKRSATKKGAEFMDALDEEKGNFGKELEGLLDSFEEVRGFNNYKRVKDYANQIDDLKTRIKESEDKVSSFNDREKLFEQPKTDYEDLTKLQEKFDPFQRLWEHASTFDFEKGRWLTCSFLKELNYAQIEKKVDSIYRETEKLIKVIIII